MKAYNITNTPLTLTTSEKFRIVCTLTFDLEIVPFALSYSIKLAKFVLKKILARACFQSNKPFLLELTASSDDDKFSLFSDQQQGQRTLLESRDNFRDEIGLLSTIIDDRSYVPSQEMVELYLYGLHWLLIFDKVILLQWTSVPF